MMHSLEDVGLVLAPTFRSRAYVQMLAARDLRPAVSFLMPGEELRWDGDEEIVLRLRADAEPFHFRPGVPVRETVAAQGWPAVELPTSDVNAREAIAALSGAAIPILIYSGLPKGVLRKPLLATGLRFLHAHGGYLPAYRGATGFYFGMLDKGRLGISAIWIDEGIDTGPIVMREWYEPIAGIEIDRVLDPAARADLLAQILIHVRATGAFPAMSQTGAAESYFVIHPVLKHLALRRAAVRAAAAQPGSRGTMTRAAAS